MTDQTPAHADRQWIGQAIDFGALVAFIGSYAAFRTIGGLEGDDAMVQATWVLVGASAIALIAGYVLEKRIAPLPLFVGAMALIFGVLTVVLDDPSLIKIKITVQNAVLAVVLLGSLPFRIYPFKVLLKRAMNLTEEGWRGLTLRYGLFFALVAVVNEIVWRTQSDDTWIAFRGGLWIASSAFGIWQVFYIMKHMIQDAPVDPVEPDPGL